MKTLITIFVLFFSSSIFASSFDYTCVSDKNWLMRYEVNTSKKTVFWVYSMSTEGGSKNEMYKYEKIVDWTDNRISIFDKYESNTSHRTIFLDTDIMINSAHYKNGETHIQIFRCTRS